MKENDPFSAFVLPDCFFSPAGSTTADADESSKTPIEMINNISAQLGSSSEIITPFVPELTAADDLSYTFNVIDQKTMSLRITDEELQAPYVVGFVCQKHPAGRLYLCIGKLFDQGILSENEKTRCFLMFTDDDLSGDRARTIDYSAGILNEAALDDLKNSLSKSEIVSDVFRIDQRTIRCLIPGDGYFVLPVNVKEKHTVFVDGREVTALPILSNRCMIPITSGDHVVTVKSNLLPYGFGILIAALAIAVYGIGILLRRKRQMRQSASD